MSKKTYDWENGAILGEHSKRKHRILVSYLDQYLAVRCMNPKQSKFRIAIVDGFSGAGKYSCGTDGSPLLFINGLQKSLIKANLTRLAKGFSPVTLSCLFIFNDFDIKAINLLKENIQKDGYLDKGLLCNGQFEYNILYSNEQFHSFYKNIKPVLQGMKIGNVVFFLDQYGYKDVELSVIPEIIRDYKNPEIFLTFSIEALLAFSNKENINKFIPDLRDTIEMRNFIENGLSSKSEFLGSAERMVFSHLNSLSNFVSPFAINNPDGWTYWFIHFSKSYRARQVYNDILHENSSMQAHFGRSGLNMLTYRSYDECSLYLFENEDRLRAKKELLEDIPRVVDAFGREITVHSFYEQIYKDTPAHAADIHQAMIENPDIKIRTKNGGYRKSFERINPDDIIQLEKQRRFIF